MPIKNARGAFRAHLVPCVALAASMFASGCAVAGEEDDEPVASTEQAASSPAASTFPATYARQWMTNLTNSVKGDGITPPVAARTYSYGAIVIYESVVNGMPGYRSLAGQLNGLGALPKPNAGEAYDWPTVLAQTMSRVTVEATYVFPLRIFFEFTTQSEASLKELGPTQIAYRRMAGVPQDVIDRSIAYANTLADALVPWINADGYATARFKGWIPPKGEDKWVPTGFTNADLVQNPVEPYFGKILRPLVLRTPDECKEGRTPPPFSTDPSSDFYKDAKHVYDKDTNSTDEEREIARYWADDPKLTATPAGHWVDIATKYLRSKNLAEAAYGYAQSSIGHYDAFIAAWQLKYEYNILRPETYIRRYIDASWRPIMPTGTPPFPSYVSGHSTMSAAAAVLATKAFGNGPVVDDTKVRRGFGVRSFANFSAAGDEAAASRIYGGIHYPFDDHDGGNVGRCVGNKVLERVAFR